MCPEPGPNALSLTVNGEARQVPVPEGGVLTVRALLDAMGLGERRVAVEVDRRIVPRAQHADHGLADGAVIEIVHFVGGG